MTDNSSSNSTIGLPVCIMRILNHPFNRCVVLSHLKFKKKEDKADMTSFKIAHLRARKGREKSVIFGTSYSLSCLYLYNIVAPAR